MTNQDTRQTGLSLEDECSDLYIDEPFVAGNDLNIEPGEDTQFLVRVHNPHRIQCEINWGINLVGEEQNPVALGTEQVPAEDDILVGDTESWDSITDPGSLDISPGTYSLTANIGFEDGSGTRHTDSQTWTDDSGTPITLVVYESDGTRPGDESNIGITDLSAEPYEPVQGGEVDILATAKNGGSATGSRTYDILVSNDKVGEVAFSELGPGEEVTKRITLSVPNTDSMQVEIGGRVIKLDTIGQPLSIGSMEASGGQNKATAMVRWVNNTSSQVTFTQKVTGDFDNSPIETDITIQPGDSKDTEINVSGNIPAGESESVQICVEDTNVRLG